MVAIKHVHKEDSENGRVEYIMRGLQHKTILELFECIIGDDDCFMVMELCPEGTLRDKMLAGVGNHWSEELAKVYFIQLCNAVKYLHEEIHLGHRDIKPANILFVQDTLKLADECHNHMKGQNQNRQRRLPECTNIPRDLSIELVLRRSNEFYAVFGVNRELLTSKYLEIFTRG